MQEFSQKPAFFEQCDTLCFAIVCVPPVSLSLWLLQGFNVFEGFILDGFPAYGVCVEESDDSQKSAVLLL